VNDLENLRKRAKAIVRQHRARSYLVPSRIRAALPRFAALTDREVLDADFALHDAQELIAVEHGFATWADLKETPPVTTTQTPTNVQLLRSLPQVFVRDIERSVAWYRDVLGFTVVFTYGEPPFYAEVRRDGAALNLRHTDRSPWDLDPNEPDLLAAAIATTDPKAIFLELKARGVELHQSLQEQPWGVDFIVRDPDGNLVLFGGPS
jgi:catechol 2,3-dioxygenase-like lactoylglutathione lyase family enzyme